MKLLERPLFLTGICALTVVFAAEAKWMNDFEIEDPLVPAKEILRGGPPRDGIPALTRPKFQAASEEILIPGSERVLGITHNGEAKAYPLSILEKHEVVNDLIGGKPVVVTYCPLCGSGITFEAEISQGRPLSFGVSGLLYNSDVLLYDRQTDTLWAQIMMKAVNGPLKGTDLVAIPTANTTWASWKQQYPETQIMEVSKLDWSRYRISSYPGYERTNNLMFSVGKTDSRYHKKALVIGLVGETESKVYPFVELEHETSPLEDTFEGNPIYVHYDRENDSAQIIDSRGNDLGGITLYWFAWKAFYAKSHVFQSENVTPKMRKRTRLNY